MLEETISQSKIHPVQKSMPAIRPL